MRIPQTIAWLVVLSGLFTSASASAALIQGIFTGGNPDVNYDLTSLGSLDWAYWNKTSDTTGLDGTPNNQKNGATLIGNIVAVAGSSLRGSSSMNRALYDFSYTGDGTSPASGSVTNAQGIFNSALDSNGAGLGLTIDLPTLQTYLITVWVGGFGAVGVFNASLPGATPYSDSSFSASGTRLGAYYTLTVTPDTAGDDLNISFVLNEQSSLSSSHVQIAAVAVSPIPEPGAIGLLTLAVLPLSLRRRR